MSQSQWPAPSAAARGYERRDRGDRGHDRRDGGWSYGQGGGGAPHNPYEIRMPRFLGFVAQTDDPEDSSIIVVDNRDERLVSPFQTWLVSEIMANAASSINVLTERDQVMPPSGGFHLALFANYTLDGIKAVLAISIESDTGHTCGNWDRQTADALGHPCVHAVQLADAPRRVSELRGSQGVQWQRDPLPLDPQRIPGRHRSHGPAAVRG